MSKIKRKQYTKNQLDEMNFHDQWSNSTNHEAIQVDKYFSAATAPEFRFAESILGDFKNQKLLDLGCGLGEAAVHFATKGANVLALDISPGMLECTKKLAKKYKVHRRIKTIQSPAEKIPLASQSIDLIFGGNVLHHVDISKASREIHRVLKKEGKAVFIEPLGYNPVIQIYRKIAGDVRTKMEKPFTFRDIEELGENFSQTYHHEQQFLTTLIFVWFFLGERLHPSKVRYWKKIIEEGDNYATAFKILDKLDQLVLKIPFINRFCWNTIIKLTK